MSGEHCEKCGVVIRRHYKLCPSCCTHETTEVVPTGATNLKDVNCLDCGYSRDFD